jgi:glycosyltransferase involved in cell wall biosynthesis
MKLIIQIPCYNEEETLPQVIADLPRELEGVEKIEYLIIDDGSSDRTVDVARELGVHHILPLGSNHGLAVAFLKGIRQCVELGADIIVNTDGDNQYKASFIKDLIQPIIEHKADIVIGCRPIEQIEEFSWLKKRLQRVGSNVVCRFSGTEVPDTTSGFRAYSAEAAMQLHVFNRYTYTLETIIQAGAMDMRLCTVPVEVNPQTRPSRLISSISSYLWRSMAVIIRSYITYKPFKTFFYTALIPGIPGLAAWVRFLYYYFTGHGSGHIQSLIFATTLLIISFNLFALGVIGHIISANRKLIHEAIFLMRTLPRQKSRSRETE